MAALIACTPSRVATSAEARQIALGPYHGDGTPVIMAALTLARHSDPVCRR